MLIVAAAIFIEDGGPVFFVQQRVGRNGRMFPCLKMRSMFVDADKRLEQLLEQDEAARREWNATQKLRRDPRLTVVGAFIRKRSLDELPQFLNVLLGHMSVVGPRPIIVEEIVRYGHRFGHYCAVQPGITGLWQINGRNNADYRSRVAMDVVYARRRSLGMDLRILAATVPVVVLGAGSY
jgi:exopolysaccharide production protein ExoY